MRSSARMREVAPTWLLQLPWLRQRRRPPQAAARSGRRDPGPHAARVRRADRPRDARAARAPRARGPALERPRDRAAARLPRAPARTGRAAWCWGRFGRRSWSSRIIRSRALRQQLRTRRSASRSISSPSPKRRSAPTSPRASARPRRKSSCSHCTRTRRGLPLFVVNVVDELVDAGTLRRDAGGWHVPERGRPDRAAQCARPDRGADRAAAGGVPPRAGGGEPLRRGVPARAAGGRAGHAGRRACRLCWTTRRGA